MAILKKGRRLWKGLKSKKRHIAVALAIILLLITALRLKGWFAPAPRTIHHRYALVDITHKALRKSEKSGIEIPNDTRVYHRVEASYGLWAPSGWKLTEFTVNDANRTDDMIADNMVVFWIPPNGTAECSITVGTEGKATAENVKVVVYFHETWKREKIRSG